MDKKNNKNIEVYDKRSGFMITINQTDAKKLMFLNYRFIFLIGLTIVSVTLFDLNIWLITAMFIVLIGVLQIVYKKFYDSLIVINKRIVKDNSPVSSSLKYMLIRSIVYFILGTAIISTTLIQYGNKINVNESFLLIIGAISIYTGFNSLKKFIDLRRD